MVFYFSLTPTGGFKETGAFSGCRMNFDLSIYVRTRIIPVLVLALFLTTSGCRVWQRTRVTSVATLESRQFVQQAAKSIEGKNMEDAQSQLKLAVKVNPENIEARTMLADTLWNQGSFSEAVKEMEKVVRHPEVQPEQIVKLAWMHFEQNNYPLAQKYVSRALQENSGIADAWILQGRLYEIEEKPEQTLAAYHQAVFLDPENEKTQTLLARRYLDLDKPQRALEVAQTARSKNRSSGVNEELLLCEGMALTRLQRNSEAVQILRQANAQAPQNIKILSTLALAQYQNGDWGQAFQSATRVLEMDPGNSVCAELANQIQIAANGRSSSDAGSARKLQSSRSPVNGPAQNSAVPSLPSPVPAEMGVRYGREVKEIESFRTSPE